LISRNSPAPIHPSPPPPPRAPSPVIAAVSVAAGDLLLLSLLLLLRLLLSPIYVPPVIIFIYSFLHSFSKIPFRSFCHLLLVILILTVVDGEVEGDSDSTKGGK
jgi:hypothetical protein